MFWTSFQRDLFQYKLAITYCLTDPPFVRMANHGIRPRIKTRPQSSVCLQQRESSVRLVMYCWKAPGGLSGVCPLHTNSSQSRRCCLPNPAMDQPTELDSTFNKMLLMGWWKGFDACGGELQFIYWTSPLKTQSFKLFFTIRHNLLNNCIHFKRVLM